MGSNPVEITTASPSLLSGQIESESIPRNRKSVGRNFRFLPTDAQAIKGASRRSDLRKDPLELVV
jgi:hypothetical protein